MSKLYPCIYCTEDGYCKKYSDEHVISWCVQSPCKDEKPSNADRIRAMTDEEMAEWVWGAETAGRAYGPRGKKAWLDWLKQEVDSD